MQNSKKLSIGILLVLGIFILSSFVLAEDYNSHQLNRDLEYSFTSNNASQCNITSGNTPYGIININQVADKIGQTFFINIKGGNFTFLGDYCFNIVCSDGQNIATGSVCRNITNDGSEMTLPSILLYILLLVFCLGMVYLSGKLYMKNPPEDDEVKLFRTKQKNGFMYYIELMKKKFYIVGSFGVYLFLLLFVVILNQVFFSIGLNELNELVKYTIIVLSWGLIPFTLFWCVYVLWSFYRTTEKILRHQFGGFGRR